MSTLKRWNGTEWEEVGRNPPAVNVVDLTNATEDYLLAVGETAFLDYVNTTSVPLHVATQEGEYEVVLTGTSLASSPTNGDISLFPNNTTYTGAFVRQQVYGYSSTAGASNNTDSNMIIAQNGLIKASLKITTTTLGKCLQTVHSCKYNSGAYSQMSGLSYWNNITIPWISLGTVTFPYAQSGKIIIKRII